LTVNKNNGAVLTAIGLSPTGVPYDGSGLAFNPDNGVAYFATGNSTKTLYTLNTSTGALTTVGPLTGASAGLYGLAFSNAPEPSSIVYLGVGVGALLVLRRFRMK